MKTKEDLLLEIDHLDNDQLEDLYTETYFSLINDDSELIPEEEKNEIRKEIGLFHFFNELHHKHIDIVLYSASIFVLLNALVDFNKDFKLHTFNMSLIILGFGLAFIGLEIMFPTLKDHKKLVDYYYKRLLAKESEMGFKKAA